MYHAWANDGGFTYNEAYSKCFGKIFYWKINAQLKGLKVFVEILPDSCGYGETL